MPVHQGQRLSSEKGTRRHLSHGRWARTRCGCLETVRGPTSSCTAFRVTPHDRSWLRTQEKGHVCTRHPWVRVDSSRNNRNTHERSTG